MSARVNVLSPSFEPERDVDGFRCSRARVGRQAGSRQLGASVYELPPGEATFPYHFHLANEELLIVLVGRPSLRSPEGWRELAEGEVVSLPAGAAGAHQVANRSRSPARVLLISEMNAPELAVFPDSGKVGAFEVAPGDSEDGLKLFLPEAAAVGYWAGEQAPGG